jgi:predicted site-specific integrase-resolvase
MEQIEGNNYLSLIEVMERLKISRSTVQRYLHNGKFDVIEIRGKIYITEESYKKLFIPKNRKISGEGEPYLI